LVDSNSKYFQGRETRLQALPEDVRKSFEEASQFGEDPEVWLDKMFMSTYVAQQRGLDQKELFDNWEAMAPKNGFDENPSKAYDNTVNFYKTYNYEDELPNLKGRKEKAPAGQFVRAVGAGLPSSVLRAGAGTAQMMADIAVPLDYSDKELPGIFEEIVALDPVAFNNYNVGMLQRGYRPSGLQMLDEEKRAKAEELMARGEAIGDIAHERRIEKSSQTRVSDWADTLRKSYETIAKDYGVTDEYLNSFLGQVATAFGELPGYVLMTLATGGAGLVPTGYEEAYSDYLTTLEPGEKPDPAKAFQYAGPYSIVSALLERTGVEGILGNLIKKGEKITAKEVAKRMAEGALGEGLTEPMQGFAMDFIAKATVDSERELFTAETLKNRLMEFGVGAITGGTAATVFAGTEKAVTTSREKAYIRKRTGPLSPEDFKMLGEYSTEDQIRSSVEDKDMADLLVRAVNGDEEAQNIYNAWKVTESEEFEMEFKTLGYTVGEYRGQKVAVDVENGRLFVIDMKNEKARAFYEAMRQETEDQAKEVVTPVRDADGNVTGYNVENIDGETVKVETLKEALQVARGQSDEPLISEQEKEALRADLEEAGIELTDEDLSDERLLELAQEFDMSITPPSLRKRLRMPDTGEVVELEDQSPEELHSSTQDMVEFLARFDHTFLVTPPKSMLTRAREGRWSEEKLTEVVKRYGWSEDLGMTKEEFAEKLAILGENRSQLRRGVWEALSVITTEGTPFAPIEEFSEDFAKQMQLTPEGRATLIKWKHATEAYEQKHNKSWKKKWDDSDAQVVEWFSDTVLGYSTGKTMLGEGAYPPSFLRFLEAVQAYIQHILDRAAVIMDMRDKGLMPEGMEEALKRASMVDEATIDSYLDAVDEHQARLQQEAADETFMTAYHGSPHAFDRFTTEKIGTGEGAQAYGWGLYFAGNKEVAEWYKRSKTLGIEYKGTPIENIEGDLGNAITQLVDDWFNRTFDFPFIDVKSNLVSSLIDDGYSQDVINEVKRISEDELVQVKTDPKLYQVDLKPSEDEYLLWDKPLSEQSEKVRSQANKIVGAIPNYMLKDKNFKASQWYERLTATTGSAKKTSLYLKSLGIRGIKYLDGSSRGADPIVAKVPEDSAYKAGQWVVDSKKGKKYFESEADARAYADSLQNYNYVIFDEADVEIEDTFMAVPTDTPAFKAWFGDSKVVDENGEPMVVYHGTGTTIEAFDPKFTGQGNDQLGSGFYFTEDASQAKGYETATLPYADQGKPGGIDSPNTIAAYLSIQNPIVLKEGEEHLGQIDMTLTEDQVVEILKNAPDIYDAIDSPLSNWFPVDEDEGYTDDDIRAVASNYTNTIIAIEGDFFRGEATAFREAFSKATGYDGVMKKFANGVTHYVAWFPTQIKSATGNRGTFDPTDPRITFSAVLGASEEQAKNVGSIDLSNSVGDTKENLRKKLNKKKGTGVGKNKVKEFAIDGKPIFIGADQSQGGKPFAGWVAENEAWLSDEEIQKFSEWYDELNDMFVAEFGEDAPQWMLAWLAGQQNESPVGAMRNAFRVRDRLAGILHGMKGGLGDEKLQAIFEGKAPAGGFGPKLSDFVDAGMGRDVRTFMGGATEGQQPFVADVHTGRDSGLVDQQTLRRLVDMADAGRLTYRGNLVKAQVLESKRTITKGKEVITPEVVKLTYKGGSTILKRDLTGSPSNTEYEGVAEWGNALTDYLNKINWKGRSDWKPRFAQAVGWMRTLRQYGLPENDLGTSLSGNTYRISAEVNFDLGVSLKDSFPSLSSLEPEKAKQITQFVIQNAVPEVVEMVAPSAYLKAMKYGTGFWEGEANPSMQFWVMGSDEAATLVEVSLAYIGEQAGTARVVFGKGGKNKRAVIFRAKGMNSEEFTGRLTDWLSSTEMKAAKSLMGYSASATPESDGIVAFGLTAVKARNVRLALEAFADEADIDIDIEEVSADATFHNNDWSKEPNGQSYAQSFKRSGGSEEVWQRVVGYRGRYKALIQEAFETYAPEALETQAPTFEAVPGGVDPETFKGQRIKEVVESKLNRRHRKLVETYKRKAKEIRSRHRKDKLTATDAIKELEELVQAMPMPIRGKIRGFATLSKKATEKGRLSYIEDRFTRIIDAMQGYQDDLTRASIAKLFERRTPRMVNGKPVGKRITPEVHARLNRLFALATTPKSQTEDEVEKILNSIVEEGREPTDEETMQIYELRTFGGLLHRDGRTWDTAGKDVLRAETALVEIIETGRSKFEDQEVTRKERMAKLREQAVETTTGGKPVYSEEEARAKGLSKERENWWDKIVAFDNMMQGLEWFLDKIDNSKAATLKGFLSTHFYNQTLEAQKNEFVGVQKATQKVVDFLRTVYKGQSLKQIFKRLQEHEKRVQQTGIYVKKGERLMEVPMSRAEAAKKWMEWQEPSLEQTFEKMGYTPETIVQIEEFMGEDLKKIALWQLQEFYPQYHDRVNKTYRKLQGVDLPFNEFYSPISREIGAKAKDDPMLKESSFFASVGSGSLKSRVNNTRPLRYTSIHQTLFNHINTMEHYIAWGDTIREMRSVLQSEEFSKGLEQYHGRNARHTLARFIDDMATGDIQSILKVDFLDRIRTRFVKGTLGLNATVFLKQLTSFPAFAMDIPVASWTAGEAQFWSNPVKYSRILLQSDYLKQRMQKGYERDVKDALRGASNKQLMNVTDVTDKLMFMTRMGDIGAILVGGWPVYRYHLNEQLKAGATREEAEKVAMREFEKSTKRSQQSSDIMDLSTLQRSGSFAKLFTMFMTSPNQYYRATIGSLRNIIKGRGSKRENLKRFVIANYVLPMMFQWAVMGFQNFWGEDEDERERMEKMIRASILGSFNGVLILGDFIEYFVNLGGGESWWMAPGLPVMDMITDFAKAIQDVVEMEDFSADEVLEVAEELSRPVSQLTGIPIDPAYKWGKAISEGHLEDPEGVMKFFGFSDYALEQK
jgi:hypothetical protein